LPRSPASADARRPAGPSPARPRPSLLREPQAGGDVVPLHVRRPPDDRHHADVAHVTLPVVPLRAAVRAADALAGADAVDRRLADRELGHRARARAGARLIGQPGGVVEEVAAGLELRPRLDERMANRLVGADRLAELPALLRISPGIVHRGRRDAV